MQDVRFAKTELDLLYRHFQRQLAVSEASTGFFINRPGFLRVFAKFVPWWKVRQKSLLLLFGSDREPIGMS